MEPTTDALRYPRQQKPRRMDVTGNDIFICVILVYRDVK